MKEKKSNAKMKQTKKSGESDEQEMMSVPAFLWSGRGRKMLVK